MSVSQPGKQKKKFSSFFKSLVIELDKDLYGPDNHLVEVSVSAEAPIKPAVMRRIPHFCPNVIHLEATKSAASTR